MPIEHSSGHGGQILSREEMPMDLPSNSDHDPDFAARG